MKEIIFVSEKMGAVQAKESMGQQIPLGGIQAKVVAVNVEGLNRYKSFIE